MQYRWNKDDDSQELIVPQLQIVYEFKNKITLGYKP